jgi:hypothetical protein
MRVAGRSRITKARTVEPVEVQILGESERIFEERMRDPGFARKIKRIREAEEKTTRERINGMRP